MKVPVSCAFSSQVVSQKVKADALGVCAALVGVGSVLGLGKLWWDSDQTKDVTKEDLLNIYDTLADITQQIIMELQRVEAETLKKDEESNESMNKNHLKRALQQKFYEAMSQAEVQIFNEAGQSPELVQKALTTLRFDTDVHARMRRMDDIIRSAQVIFEPELPESLTSEKTLEIVYETMKCMTETLAETISELKTEGVEDVNASIETWQPRYVEKIQPKLQKLHEKHSISQEDLQAAISKYHEDPLFADSLEKIQNEQDKALSEMGLDPST